MLFLQRIPRLVRWIVSVLLLFLLLMTLGRFIIFWKFNPPGKAFSGSAFIMGLRFDARVVCVIGLLMLLLCAIPYINPFKNSRAKTFWNIFLPVLFLLMILVLAIDYYHFDYLHQRLNATVLNYLQDAGISFSMMWQSYPLPWIGLALILALLLGRLLFSRLLARYMEQESFYKRKARLVYVLTFLVLGGFIFGKIGQFPLRWSDAYTLSDDFKANLALNPFQSFLSTLNFRNASYDIQKVKAGYPLMASALGLSRPDSNALNFERIVPASGVNGNRPNVVLVICESFSAYKSSMYNNPLN
ncbi:MAG TPA: hypothetical protein PK678_12355, partial [Ferruginibacter sp.]|nr:hypothetical protein [Ferruginibacter sp.]